MHKKEPWRTDAENGFPCDVHSADGTMVLRATPSGDTGESIARRIVACVNACAGYTNENLEEFGRWLSSGEVPAVLEIERRLEEAEQQRDELRSELERAQKWIAHRGNGLPDHACAQCVPHSDILIDGFVCAYHAAIAKVTQS